jgi:hypothetical protein
MYPWIDGDLQAFLSQVSFSVPSTCAGRSPPANARNLISSRSLANLNIAWAVALAMRDQKVEQDRLHCNGDGDCEAECLWLLVEQSGTASLKNWVVGSNSRRKG